MFTKRAYTFIELIITLTIFSVVAVLCVTALVNSMASARRIQAQVFLYTEAQALMDQLAASIQQNAVDYEAYYLRYGYETPETGWETLLYGYYGQSFYNPGPDDPSILEGPYDNIYGYGVECTEGDPSDGYYPDDCPLETPNYDYQDTNEYTHPFAGIMDFLGYSDDDESNMNAFCESADGSIDCDAMNYHFLDELILINGDGDKRTVFAKELINGSEYTISTIHLVGTDSDYDGVVDSWLCSSDFDCSSNGGVPDETDLINNDDPEDGYFMPVSPNMLNIESFQVLVSPLEDPYRAVAEENMQVQPQITIIMTVTLDDEHSNRLLGDAPTITIERTISTGVYSTVTSYE